MSSFTASSVRFFDQNTHTTARLGALLGVSLALVWCHICVSAYEDHDAPTLAGHCTGGCVPRYMGRWYEAQRKKAA